MKVLQNDIFNNLEKRLAVALRILWVLSVKWLVSAISWCKSSNRVIKGSEFRLKLKIELKQMNSYISILCMKNITIFWVLYFEKYIVYLTICKFEKSEFPWIHYIKCINHQMSKMKQLPITYLKQRRQKVCIIPSTSSIITKIIWF